MWLPANPRVPWGRGDTTDTHRCEVTLLYIHNHSWWGKHCDTADRGAYLSSCWIKATTVWSMTGNQSNRRPLFVLSKPFSHPHPLHNWRQHPLRNGNHFYECLYLNWNANKDTAESPVLTNNDRRRDLSWMSKSDCSHCKNGGENAALLENDGWIIRLFNFSILKLRTLIRKIRSVGQKLLLMLKSQVYYQLLIYIYRYIYSGIN